MTTCACKPPRVIDREPKQVILNNSPILEDITPKKEISEPTNAQVGTFLADQSMVNDWQAKGIAVVGGAIYLSVFDNKSNEKKGSIIKMNSSDGKAWKEIGSSLVEPKHTISENVQGLAVSGSTVIAVDSTSKVYTLDSSKGSIKITNGIGGKDISIGSGNIFISNEFVGKYSLETSLITPIKDMNVTAGIGADNLGNVYSVSGNIIKKADTTGQVEDIITNDLWNPIDVAINNRNGDIYVLESTMIKRFNTNGQLLSSFPNGAIKASSIAVDESGSVYVADTATSNKTSKIVKFGASIDKEQINNTKGIYNYGAFSDDITIPWIFD